MCPTKKRKRITSERKHNGATKTFRKISVEDVDEYVFRMWNVKHRRDYILYGSANDVNYNNFVA